jgi:hypothetical protein
MTRKPPALSARGEHQVSPVKGTTCQKDSTHFHVLVKKIVLVCVGKVRQEVWKVQVGDAGIDKQVRGVCAD